MSADHVISTERSGQSDGYMYERQGKSWQPEEDQQLTDAFRAAAKIIELCAQHQRRRGAIRSRLRRLGLIDGLSRRIHGGKSRRSPMRPSPLKARKYAPPWLGARMKLSLICYCDWMPRSTTRVLPATMLDGYGQNKMSERNQGKVSARRSLFSLEAPTSAVPARH